jgi:hypothetical protein
LRTTRIVIAAAALLAIALAAGEAAASFDSKDAQGTQPNRVSPHESVSGAVDGATLTITYGRPSMRGREIFGALVPYGRVWCPGADEATTLDSDHPLLVGGALRVPPGPHTIWILPTAGVWTLVVSKEPSGFHTRYNERADLGRLAMQKLTIDIPVDRLTFAIDAVPSGSGRIAMLWETTRAWVPFTVVR